MPLNKYKWKQALFWDLIRAKRLSERRISILAMVKMKVNSSNLVRLPLRHRIPQEAIENIRDEMISNPDFLRLAHRPLDKTLREYLFFFISSRTAQLRRKFREKALATDERRATDSEQAQTHPTVGTCPQPPRISNGDISKPFKTNTWQETVCSHPPPSATSSRAVEPDSLSSFLRSSIFSPPIEHLAPALRKVGLLDVGIVKAMAHWSGDMVDIMIRELKRADENIGQEEIRAFRSGLRKLKKGAVVQ